MRRTLTLVLVAGATLAAVIPARAEGGCAAIVTVAPGAPESRSCSFVLERDGDVAFAGAGKWKVYAPLPDLLSFGHRDGVVPRGDLGASVAIGDLDGDGRAEVVAGEPGADDGVGALLVTDDELLPRQRIGSVANAGRLGASVAIGDLDADGDADILAAAPGGGGGSDGTPPPPDSIIAFDGKTGHELWRFDGLGAAGRGDVRLGIGDFDGDGATDVVVASPGAPGEAGEARIFLGLRFDDPMVIEGEPGDRLGASLAIGDLDGDGKADLVLGGPGGGGGGGVLLAVSNEGRDRVRIHPVGAGQAGTTSFGQSVSVADVDGDGRPDIVVASQRSHDDGVERNAVTVLKLAPSAGGVEHTILWDTAADLGPVRGPTVRVAAGDVTGDGAPDVVASVPRPGRGRDLVVLSHQGRLIQTLLRPDVDTDGDDLPEALVLGDLTGDGRLDLVVGSPSADRSANDVGRVTGLRTITETFQSGDIPTQGQFRGRALTRITIEAGGVDPAGNLQSGFIYSSQV